MKAKSVVAWLLGRGSSSAVSVSRAETLSIRGEALIRLIGRRTAPTECESPASAFLTEGDVVLEIREPPRSGSREKKSKRQTVQSKVR